MNDTTEACIVIQMQWFFKNGQFEGDIICRLKTMVWQLLGSKALPVPINDI